MKRKKQFNYNCVCGKKIRSDYKKHFKSYYHNNRKDIYFLVNILYQFSPDLKCFSTSDSFMWFCNFSSSLLPTSCSCAFPEDVTLSTSFVDNVLKYTNRRRN